MAQAAAPLLASPPLEPKGGAKRSNSIKSEIPNFVYLLTNERYITYQTGFSFGRLGHAQGWDLGVPLGVGGKKKIRNQPDLVCGLLT